MFQMDLFAKIINCFQPLSSFEKSAYNIFDRVLNTPLKYIHIVYQRISLWHWYGLMDFSKDLNEHQSLKKLIYCWIKCLQCWIITFNVREQNIKKVSFYINKTSIVELMSKSVKSKHFGSKTDKTDLYNYMAWFLYN